MKTKIIYAALAILTVSQSFMFYRFFYSGSQPYMASMSGQIPSGKVSQADLAGVVTGGRYANSPDAQGIIVQLHNDSVEIKGNSGTIITFATDASTKVQILGKYKSAETQKSELDAYNAQVQELMKDPQKNKAALAALQQPQAREVTQGTLSDLAVGDDISVFYISNTEHTADLIIKASSL